MVRNVCPTIYTDFKAPVRRPSILTLRGNKIIEPDFSSEGAGEVQCRQRLGGLLRYYYRESA
ncbi:MAG: hypothetical protein ACI9NC_004509 [Verrucomicrobiales bacterium]|jgi:hypothetical protein